MATRKGKAWTYRVAGIPFGTSDQALIERYFHRDDQSDLTVRSLYPNAACPEGKNDGELVATVFFSPKDLRTDGPRLQRNGLDVSLEFIGFTPLYVPRAGTPIVADIIAVTGLAGHAYGSWAHQENGMWLRDYLKPTAPNARILTYGYNSKLEGSLSTRKFLNHADTFLYKLIEIRRKGKCESRPIIFVGHSLGCLMIKQAMINARFKNSPLPVRAIIFLAAPHAGLEIEALETLVKGQPSEDLIRELKKGSPTLSGMRDNFAEMAHDIDILTCCETRQTRQAVPLQNGRWARDGSPILMVDSDSAILGSQRETRIDADADHSEIAKIKPNDAGIFPDVTSAIQRALCPTVSLAEEHQGPALWTSQRGLRDAVVEDRLDVVNMLLNTNKALDVDAADKDGYTSLHLAARRGFVDICMALLDHKASIHTRTSEACFSRTPLLEAIFHGQASVVRLLLQRGAYIKDQYDSTVRRWFDLPLFSAAAKGDMSCLEHLVKYADVNFQFDGMNAIAHAAYFGRVNAIRFLLDNHASGFPPPRLNGKWKNVEFNKNVDDATMDEVMRVLRDAKHR